MDDKIIDAGTPTYSVFMAEALEHGDFIEMDLSFPVGSFAMPEAIVMLHPIVRNYYHIRQIEERTGRVAIAKLGYIELVKP